jgi:hypothetical protein
VIRRVNRRFGTSFDVFEHTEENARLVLRDVEEHARRMWGSEESFHRSVAAPSRERAVMKDRLQPEFRAQRNRRLRERAEGLYRALTER